MRHLFPQKNISVPVRTVAVVSRISAGGFERKTGNPTGSFSTSLRYEYNNVEMPEQVIAIPISTPSESVMVTGISLQYPMIKNGHEA